MGQCEICGETLLEITRISEFDVEICRSNRGDVELFARFSRISWLWADNASFHIQNSLKIVLSVSQISTFIQPLSSICLPFTTINPKHKKQFNNNLTWALHAAKFVKKLKQKQTAELATMKGTKRHKQLTMSNKRTMTRTKKQNEYQVPTISPPTPKPAL